MVKTEKECRYGDLCMSATQPWKSLNVVFFCFSRRLNEDIVALWLMWKCIFHTLFSQSWRPRPKWLILVAWGIVKLYWFTRFCSQSLSHVFSGGEAMWSSKCGLLLSTVQAVAFGSSTAARERRTSCCVAKTRRILPVWVTSIFHCTTLQYFGAWTGCCRISFPHFLSWV